jgi:predicted TIM-barrel fold metal-dependent hydrolase
MDRRSFLKYANAAGLAAALPSSFAAESKSSRGPKSGAAKAKSNTPADTLLLKDYRPVSLFKVPVTEIAKAKFPIIDMHSHPYAKTAAEIDTWIKNMDAVNVEKTMILTMTSGKEFDQINAQYSKYPDRFEVWCGLDFTGYDQPTFPATAIKELQRCRDAGAKGIGEIHDKGQGLHSGKSNAPKMHPDDPRMDGVWDKAAELHMPVSLHVADPIWMYKPMDKHNDGLMNALSWRLDNQPDIIKLAGMVDILERTAARHRNTTFVACHFANCDYDLSRLGEAFDRNPNLYADIAARYGETAPIPRFAAKFYAKYANRLVYGTDMGFEQKMYHTTFRILESEDEHFYEFEQFNYHWPLYGLGLNDDIMKQVYHETGANLLAAR